MVELKDVKMVAVWVDWRAEWKVDLKVENLG